MNSLQRRKGRKPGTAGFSLHEGVGLRVGADRLEFSGDGTAPPRLAQ